MKDLPRTSGFTLIERPWGREVHTTPLDTPEQLAQLFAHLERTGMQVPDVLLRLLHRNVAPVSVVLLAGGTATAGETESAFDVASAPITNSSGVVPPSPAPVTQDSPGATRGNAKWLSEVIEAFRVFKSRNAWKNEQTWTNAVGPDLSLFRGLISDAQRDPLGTVDPEWDIRMCDITEDHMERAIADLRRYPKRQGRRAGEDVKRALANGGEPASDVTVQKKLERILAFMTWASQKKYCSADLCTAITLELQEFSDSEDSGYRGFEPEELQLIFSSPAYQQDTFDEAWKHYTPLLCLTTSMRVRELADLTVEDVIEDKGVPCLWIRDGTVTFKENGKVRTVMKRVKSRSAKRRIPLSRAVLDSGFMSYVQKRRAEGKVWLWENLKWEEKSGWGRRITEWFAKYLDELSITEHDTVLHSFRTNFNSAVSETNLTDESIQALMGHAPTSQRGKSYSRGKRRMRKLPLTLVWETLLAIDWGIQFIPSRKWS